MDDLTLDKDLQNFDFSSIHPVKDKILKNLLEMQRNRKNTMGIKLNLLQNKQLKRLDFGSLQYAVAAGNSTVRTNDDETEEEDNED